MPQGYTLDPNAASRDLLYAIYRKGIITRHITINGRFLEMVALENVDLNQNERTVFQDGNIRIKHSSGYWSNFPIEKARYSMEQFPGAIEARSQLWVPIIAPMKYPGNTHTAHWIMAGVGDNPLYYGGMAIATFMMEHHYHVSPHSIEYARRMIEFFLESEMNGENGYFVRRASFFSSSQNVHGEPFLRGASSEELLGCMLGLMYYLRYEDPQHPLYQKAKSLRDRVLATVARGHILSKYNHGFMNTTSDDESYRVKHFEYALNSSCSPHPAGSKQLYISTLTLGAGDTRPHGGNFFDYCMFLTSMILILEGELSTQDKQWFAKVFMRDVIKASLTAGPDRQHLQGNAYLASLALLCNKHLNSNDDPYFLNPTLLDIWDHDLSTFEALISEIDNTIIFANDPARGGQLWQHNLPLATRTNHESRNVCLNHNPRQAIGKKGFDWIYKANTRYWQMDDGDWYYVMPGWDNGELNEREYMQSNAKVYSRVSYVHQELVGYRQRNDIQVEGSGLGLFFLRMLATHITSIHHPPPAIPVPYDQVNTTISSPLWFPPYVGVSPYIVSNLRYQYSYKSKYPKLSVPDFKINGDQPKALRVVAVQNIIITAHAKPNDKLILSSWKVSDGQYEPGHPFWEPAGIFRTRSYLGNHFDEVNLASMRDPNDHSKSIFIVCERAEEKRNWKRDLHWARIALWRVEHTRGDLTHLSTWESEVKAPQSFRQSDCVVIDHNKFAVTFVTKTDGYTRLWVFSVNPVDYSLNRIANIGTNRNLPENYGLHIAAAYKKYVITSTGTYTVVETYKMYSRFQLFVYQLPDNHLTRIFTTTEYPGKLMDMAVIKHIWTHQEYLITVSISGYNPNERYTDRLYVRCFKIDINGQLIDKDECADLQPFQAENKLLNAQFGYENISIKPANLNHDNHPGFIITAKAYAFPIKIGHFDYKPSKQGLKVLHGYVMNDGCLTIEDMNVIGNGKGNGQEMLDVSEVITTRDSIGVVTAHKTYDEHLNLTYWRYKDLWYSSNAFHNQVLKPLSPNTSIQLGFKTIHPHCNVQHNGALLAGINTNNNFFKTSLYKIMNKQHHFVKNNRLTADHNTSLSYLASHSMFQHRTYVEKQAMIYNTTPFVSRFKSICRLKIVK